MAGTTTGDIRQGSRTLSTFLMFIGLVALGISMWMGFRFGWGLSQDLADRATLALLHVLVDPAAAGLVLAGSMMMRWGWKREGWLFYGFALMLVLYSMLSVYGFMSARIAVTQSHDSVVAMQMGRLDWTQKSSINKELPRSERRLLRADAKEMSKEIRASLAIVPDAQAASIAAALGVRVEKVQRALVMIASGIAQSIKFVCIICGVMVWPRSVASPKQEEAAPPKSDMGGGGKNIHVLKPADAGDAADAPKKIRASANMRMNTPQRSASVPSTGAFKMSPSELQEYLDRYANGPRPTQLAIARETGWSQPTVSRQLLRAQERANRKAARANARFMNGSAQGFGGSYHAPAAV